MSKEKFVEAFSNHTRLKILTCLYDKSRNVTCLVGDCDISQSALSQHLKLLRELKLIKFTSQGRIKMYELVDKEAGKIAKSILSFINKKV